mgnify:FL=1
MNKQIRIRALFTILISLMFVFSLTACGKKEPKKEEKKPSKASVTEKLEQKRKAAYQAYKTVIEQNQSAIKAYSWQTVPGKDTYNSRGIDRPISLCDVDGDKIP